MNHLPIAPPMRVTVETTELRGQRRKDDIITITITMKLTSTHAMIEVDMMT